LRKSNWKNRNIDEVKKRQKEKDVLLGKRRWFSPKFHPPLL
jgi:hypothetical protein